MTQMIGADDPKVEDRNALSLSDFCPPPPPHLEGWLMDRIIPGVELIHVVGPVPVVAQAEMDAPPIEHRFRRRASVPPTRHDPYPVEPTPRWLRLEATYRVVIEGHDRADIAKEYGLAVETANHATGRERS